MAKKKSVVTGLDPKVRYVMDKYDDSKSHYSELRDKFSDWDDIFYNVPGEKNFDWMSNLFVPTTHKAIMTLLSRVVNNTFMTDPPYDVVPSNKNLSNLIRSQMYRGDFFTQWVLFCIQLLVRGTSICKVSWQKQTKTKFSLEKVFENVMKEMINEMGQPEQRGIPTFKGYQKKPKQVIKYDGPIFETIDLFDYFPEPSAKGIEGARIFRSIIPMNTFMRGRNYINKEQVLGTSVPESEIFPQSRLRNLGVEEPSYTASEFQPTEKAKQLTDFVQLLECETKWWNPKTQRLEPWLSTIANQKVLVRDEAFPYWNCESLYLKGAWIPVLNEFYGVGIPELAESLQEELNDKRNQRIDNVNQVLQPIFEYEEGAIDPKILAAFERKPGGKLRMRPGAVSGNATRWDVAPDVTASATIECANIEKDIEEITGAVRAIQPSSISGEQIHRTSSGLMLLQSMAHEKIKLNLNILEKSVLEPLWEKYFDLNLQFLTPGYKIFNPEGQPEIYTPEKIAGDYEFRAKGSRYALDQQMKIMNISRVIESLGASGIPLGELHIKFWMKLYDALGFEDKNEIEKILRQEIQKHNQQQMQLAMMKQQGKGGGGGGGMTASTDMLNQSMGVDQTRAGAGQMIPGGGM